MTNPAPYQTPSMNDRHRKVTINDLSAREANTMTRPDCPFVLSELAEGAYHVTDACQRSVKEGFRPRVAFAYLCAGCPHRKDPT